MSFGPSAFFVPPGLRLLVRLSDRPFRSSAASLVSPAVAPFIKAPMRGTSLAETGTRVLDSAERSVADVGVIVVLAVAPLLWVAEVVDGDEYNRGSSGGVAPPVGEIWSGWARSAACAICGEGSER